MRESVRRGQNTMQHRMGIGECMYYFRNDTYENLSRNESVNLFPRGGSGGCNRHFKAGNGWSLTGRTGRSTSVLVMPDRQKTKKPEFRRKRPTGVGSQTTLKGCRASYVDGGSTSACARYCKPATNPESLERLSTSHLFSTSQTHRAVTTEPVQSVRDTNQHTLV